MFLPEKYEVPQSAGNYMKFEEGANKFRVLTSAIVGWEWWVEENGKRTPMRTRDFTKVPNEYRGECKHFWAFAVYNYKAKKVQLLEVTQKTIMATISNLVRNEDWGDPKGYDITVNRKGEGLETEYQVVPVPHKPFEEQVGNVKEIELEALYEGEDPFENYSPEAVDPSDLGEGFEAYIRQN